MMNPVIATQSPDSWEIDVKPLFSLVENILGLLGLGIDEIFFGMPKKLECMDDNSNRVAITAALESLSYTINQISYELTIKTLSGRDAHTTTTEIFGILSNFPWGAKLVLALAAFALNYCGFVLLKQNHLSSRLARSITLLKRLLAMTRLSPVLFRRSLNNLVSIMLDITALVVIFEELPTAYISRDLPAFSTGMALIPVAAYWTIRSVVACTAQINITSENHEYASSISPLSVILMEILEYLKPQISICNDHVAERMAEEAYDILVDIFNDVHINNMKVLKALINAGDDVLPLIDGISETRVGIEVLRRKNVLLLISVLNVHWDDQLRALERIYSESRTESRSESPYEVVWIPIMDSSIQWTKNTEQIYKWEQSMMKWYTVNHPSLIGRGVPRFSREKWNFREEPILVVLDPQGKVVHLNAIHMMQIWGSSAFPFTSLREEELWKDEVWRLELLVDGINDNILNWIREDKYIFLFGGDDMEWIRKLITTARQVAQTAGISLEMVYAGKWNNPHLFWKMEFFISRENLTTVSIWDRLEIMLRSKLQLGRSDELDPVTWEITRLLSYDNEGGWAVLSKGSKVVVNGHGKTVLKTLLEYELWKDKVALLDYGGAFQEHYENHHVATSSCCQFDSRKIPDNVKCPECQRIMQKFTNFVCRHEVHRACTGLRGYVQLQENIITTATLAPPRLPQNWHWGTRPPKLPPLQQIRPKTQNR